MKRFWFYLCCKGALTFLAPEQAVFGGYIDHAKHGFAISYQGNVYRKLIVVFFVFFCFVVLRGSTIHSVRQSLRSS